LVALLALSPALSAPAREGWHPSFADAQAASARSGKGIFLCFTGKEWSAVCRQFEQHFLADPGFTEMLKKDFEPVQLDVSAFRDMTGKEEDPMPEEARLKLEFEVTTFPVVFLIGRDGRPYAVTGFRPGGIDSYAKHLEKLRESHAQQEALLARARQSSGPRRAELIAQALPDIGAFRMAQFYGDLMREVVKLDPENTTGFARDFEIKLGDHEYVKAMREMDRDLRWSDMLALTDAYIEKYKLTGSELQAALMNRFDILRRQQNFPEMVLTLDEVYRINPYNPHGRQAQQFLAKMAQQIEEQSLLESLQNQE
jgi:thioredoxin-related protein